MSMRKESGEITTDREEILKICANFYKSLYTQTVPTPESTMKSSPDTEEIPEFTAEEVERAIKRMKRHKAQGVDGITSDIIKLGGPVVLTYLTNIFNNILKTKQIPDSWYSYGSRTPNRLSVTGAPDFLSFYLDFSLSSLLTVVVVLHHGTFFQRGYILCPSHRQSGCILAVFYRQASRHSGPSVSAMFVHSRGARETAPATGHRRDR